MPLLIQTRLAVTPISTVHKMSGDSCLSDEHLGSCFCCTCYISELSPHLAPVRLCTNPPWGRFSILHLHKPVYLCLSQFLSHTHIHILLTHMLTYITHACTQPCAHVHTCTHTVTQAHHLRRVMGLPWWLSGMESAHPGRGRRFDPWSGKIPWAHTPQLCSSQLKKKPAQQPRPSTSKNT